MKNKPAVVYTYRDIAEATGASLNSLYAIVSRHPNLLVPIDPTASVLEFAEDVYNGFIDWWEENSRFRVVSDPPPGEAFDIEGAQNYLNAKFALFQHTRRRYNLLYPDYYVANPAGRGRPVAMYLRSSLDEYKAWVERGKPEPPHSRVRFLLLDQGKFEATVHFHDGTVVALAGDEAKVSPEGGQHDEPYIRFARFKLAQEKAKIARRAKRRRIIGSQVPDSQP